MKWLKGIPIPPPELEFKVITKGKGLRLGPNGTFETYDIKKVVPVLPDGWVWDNPLAMGFPLYYHPNATYGIRSIPEDGVTSGAQAMYDDKGKLITDGLSAGTADKVSPNQDPGGHMRADVDPYDKARRLDGYYGGTKYRDMYRKVRPPNTGKACEKIVN